MSIPDWLSQFISSPWLAVILLLGAFGDAFIGTSLFIFGEIFFVGAGYAMHINHQWWLILLIWLGAFTGDMVSYQIGKHYGEGILKRFIKTGAKRRLTYYRAKKLLQQHSAKTLITARLAGPVAKLTPLLAGSLGIPTATMIAASIIGVLLGTAQFITGGWFLAQGINYWENIKTFLMRHLWLSGSIIALLPALFLLIILRKLRRKRESEI